ncbi:ABC transporter permease [Streptomyces antibioticus]|uniref:ABC transporter permease n=1 Tax=Streptomyces antibioticus TaxID=1890 RepID=UPI00225A9B77|nr:ABC transporter permease [Streptomyces antibioticus]MCX5166632.1 ABC transporter permease [Streptomyces antibioticus]
MTAATTDASPTTLKAKAARPSARRRLRSPAIVLPPLLVVTALLAVWQTYTSAAAVDPTVLPSPWRVLSQGWENRQDLWDATLPTLQETVAGFGMSFVAAWLVAVLLDFSTWARRGLYPLLVASQTIPIVAVAPLLIIWFGFGLFPKTLVVTLATFFPLTANLAAGFASADPEAMRLLRSLGAGRTRTFLMVRVPSAMPYFFAGLRVSITYAVVGAVFAEYAGAENGLGIYMQAQKSAFRTDLVFAAVAVTAALSIALFATTYLLQRLALPWERATRRKDHP